MCWTAYGALCIGGLGAEGASTTVSGKNLKYANTPAAPKPITNRNTNIQPAVLLEIRFFRPSSMQPSVYGSEAIDVRRQRSLGTKNDDSHIER